MPCIYSVVEWRACRRRYQHSGRNGNCMVFPVVKGEETNESGLKVQQSQTGISIWSQESVGVTPQLLYSHPVTARALFPSCSFHRMDVHSKRSISTFSETTSIKTPPPPQSLSLSLLLCLSRPRSPFLTYPLNLALFFAFFPSLCLCVSLSLLQYDIVHYLLLVLIGVLTPCCG